MKQRKLCSDSDTRVLRMYSVKTGDVDVSLCTSEVYMPGHLHFQLCSLGFQQFV